MNTGYGFKHISLALVLVSLFILFAGCAAFKADLPERAWSYDDVNAKWNEHGICLYDLTGDGIPEICVNVLAGSGFITYEVHVYDMITKKRIN